MSSPTNATDTTASNALIRAAEPVEFEVMYGYGPVSVRNLAFDEHR